MPVEDLWETEPDSAPTREQETGYEQSATIYQRPANRPQGRHARRRRSGPASQLNAPRLNAPRRTRERLLALGTATGALAVFCAGAWFVSGTTSRTSSADTEGTQLQAGVTGQIVGIGGLCLEDGKGGIADRTPVILATCSGTEQQQEWTLANKEIMAGGRCLGVNPGTAGQVGLYACNKSESVSWSLSSRHTIVSASSGLCLGSEDDQGSNGAQVGVTACQPTAKDQMWTVPSYAADPSGLAVPIGNLPGWRQDFTDDFTKNVPVGQFPKAVSSKWDDYPDGWQDTSRNGTYEPTKVVSIHNGTMNLFLHTVDGVHMVAAPLPIIPGADSAGGTLYGRYEVRFKADPVSGYKTAWLLWPDSNKWPQGEIDFPEGNLNSSISGFLHQLGDPETESPFPTSAQYNSWHTATIVWTANSITFLLDGKVVGESKNKAFIPDTPMHWVLQTETRTSGAPPSDTASANVQIDWVAIWLPQQS